MSKIDLKGMGVALITPFKEDESIDFEALSSLIEYQIENGTDYLVALGTTGETPTLGDDEKSQLAEFIASKVNRRIPIILGEGGNDTRAIVDKLKKKNYPKGIDGILSVVPYYSKPTQGGIYQHYKAIAEASPYPVILYNVPGRTGVNMTAETTLRLANGFRNIIATKEASGNMCQINEIIRHKPTGFGVISGDDGIAFPLATMGSIGVISVMGNAFPKEFGEMMRLALKGSIEDARAMHHQFSELFALLFADGNPAGIKCLLHAMKRIENRLRLPLTPVSDEIAVKIKSALTSMNINH